MLQDYFDRAYQIQQVGCCQHAIAAALAGQGGILNHTFVDGREDDGLACRVLDRGHPLLRLLRIHISGRGVLVVAQAKPRLLKRAALARRLKEVHPQIASSSSSS
jgi:predicted metal-binding protein